MYRVNMSDLIIRPYNNDDKDDVIKLWLECVLIFSQNYSKRGVATESER